MNGMGDEFLPGTGLAAQEHGCICAGHLRHLFVNLPHRAGVATILG